MDATYLIGRLAAGAPAVVRLVDGLDDAAWRRRPDPERWSPLEIVCHLRDEEREDFRVRLDHTLHRPGVAWPPIDPPGWVTARDYAVQDPAAVVAELVAERAQSITWLEGLDAPDWDLVYEHPLLGRLTAGDLLTAWAAHDLLHLRQLTGVIFGQVAAAGGDHGTSYAGDW